MTDDVCISIPLKELQNAKININYALVPQVTFNDDFEVMKTERDKLRAESLAELQVWINEKLR